MTCRADPMAVRFLTVLVTGSFLLLFFAGCEGSETKTRPHLLLISLDTLRADHLGCYGYERPTSPFIDSLTKKKEVILFEQCIAQAPTTAPSHMTLFTSLFPTVHGVADQTAKAAKTKRVPAEATFTLAQILKKAGYITAGFTDGGFLNPQFGFDRGFETYHCKYEAVERKVDRAMAWLKAHAFGDKPFFLFLHTYEIHGPYLPPPLFRDRFTGQYTGWVRDYCFGPQAAVEKKISGFKPLFERRDEFSETDVQYLEALYDGEIAYTDNEMERLWRFLHENRLLDNLVVAILSDHGEEFCEHGGFGHRHLFDEVIHVPLILFLPPNGRYEISRNRIQEQVSLMDVMPTLLDTVSIKIPSYLQGVSLKSLWEEKGGVKSHPAFSEAIAIDEEPLVSSVRLDGKKLINYMGGKHIKFFDLKEDRAESQNLASKEEKEKKRFLGLLDRWRGENLRLRKVYKASAVKGDVPAQLQEELEQLGY